MIEADTPWFMQKTNKVLDTGLASLMKALGALSMGGEGRRVSKTGLCAPRNQPKRERERERDRDRDRDREKQREIERERKKDTGTQALMEQRCFNDFSVSLYRL